MIFIDDKNLIIKSGTKAITFSVAKRNFGAANKLACQI